jgi:tetratricopeptide (TPR) repeat protein
MVATAIPELEDPAQAKAALAQLEGARQFHEAASLAAKAMTLWPEDADFRAERTKSLLAAGALLEAESAAREALLAEASDAQKEAAWIILADALIRQERAADAREALREACFAMPGSVALQARRGHQAAQVGDYPEAIDAYQAACDLAPEREALHLGLLSGLWMAKRYALGSAAAARAVEQFPESAVMRQQQANFLLSEGRNPEATAAARSAIAKDPSVSSSYWTLVSALWADERHNEALRELVRACETLPGDAFLLMQLGRTARILSQHELAVRGYELAVARPDAPEIAWTGLVQTLIELDRLPEAFNYAKMGALSRSDIIEMPTLLAEVILRQGADQETAPASLADTLGLAASSSQIQDAIIGALMRLDRWSEALALLEGLIAQAPREPDIAVKYARALTGSGALSKAEELLEVVLTTNPDFIPAWQGLCDTLRRQKRIKEALAAYRRMEALGASQKILRETRYNLFGEYD